MIIIKNNNYFQFCLYIDKAFFIYDLLQTANIVDLQDDLK